MKFSGAVLDVDGTVVRGNDPIPGAPAGYRRLREAGVETLFVSNNPTKTPPAYVDRLGTAGYEINPDQVFTAGTVTTRYLRERHADDDELLCIGSSGLLDQFEAAGLATTDDVDAADALVASIDREFDYDDLCTALWALDRDIPFIGTDPDVVIPAPERDVPGSGAVINAIAGVAEREPDAVLGKPSETAIEMVRERLPYPRRVSRRRGSAQHRHRARRTRRDDHRTGAVRRHERGGRRGRERLAGLRARRSRGYRPRHRLRVGTSTRPTPQVLIAASTTSASRVTFILNSCFHQSMREVTSHENETGDDEEDPEQAVRVIEGHAVQFNEYRY